MRTSTKRILSIGLAGFLFIGALVVYAGFIRPELEVISQKRAVSASKTNLFNNQKLAVGEVQKLIGEFQSIAQLQETVSLAVPLRENVTQALNQLEAIVRASRVNLRSFTVKPGVFEPGKMPLAKRLGSLDLSVVVDGNYEGIRNFIKSLETNVRVANIQSFSIGGVAGTSQELYSMTITVEVYYQE
mgnify:CR=1 FL=1